MTRADVQGRFELEAAAGTARRFLDGDSGPHAVANPSYHMLSAWLRQRARPGELIAMQEVGITAFYSGLRVLDTYGLADARVARAPGPPSGKAAAGYVFGQTPDFFVIRLAANGLRPGLLADRVYATHARMAFEYSLARFFPDARERRIAVFSRRPGLVSAESLQHMVPEPARIASAASPHIEMALAQIDPETPELAAAGRLHFKSWIEGIQWNPDDREGATTLEILVPDTGQPIFEATIAPPQPEGTGIFVVSVAPTGSVLGEVARLSQTANRRPVARDLSIDLSKWKGRRVSVRLLYQAADGPNTCTPGWLIWMEPRLVVLDERAPRGGVRAA